MVSIQDAIFNITSNPYERATLLYSCGAESGCMPIHQTSGPASGYYQIEPGHGVTPECANDPTCATAAFYSKWNVPGCTTQQGDLWQSDPAQAAYLAARCAEGGGSSAANNIGAPYNASQRQTGESFAALSLPIIGGLGNIARGIDRAANRIPGIGNGTPSDQIDNPSLTPAGQAAIGFYNLLTSPDFIVRMALIIGGLAIGVVSISHLMGIETAPIPVPV